MGNRLASLLAIMYNFEPEDVMWAISMYLNGQNLSDMGFRPFKDRPNGAPAFLIGKTWWYRGGSPTESREMSGKPRVISYEPERTFYCPECLKTGRKVWVEIERTPCGYKKRKALNNPAYLASCPELKCSWYKLAKTFQEYEAYREVKDG